MHERYSFEIFGEIANFAQHQADTDRHNRLGTAILDVSRQVRPALKKLADAHGLLSIRELMIMIELYLRGPMLRCELSRAVHIDECEVGRAYRSLENLGLMSKRPRQQALSLTDAGLGASAAILRHMRSLDRYALRGVTDSDRTHAIQALRLITTAILQSSSRATGKRERSIEDPGTKIKQSFVMQLAVGGRPVSSAASDKRHRPAFSRFQSRVLVEIAAAPISAATLAGVLGCDKGQLSRMLHRLMTEGLVAARRRGRDQPLFLTEQGWAASQVITAADAARECVYRDMLDAEARASLERTLSTVAANMKQLEDFISLVHASRRFGVLAHRRVAIALSIPSRSLPTWLTAAQVERRAA